MRQLYFLLIIFIGTVGCYKTEVNETEEVFEEIPKILIQETDIVNILQDLNGNPITGKSYFNHQQKESSSVAHFEASNINKYGESIKFIDNNGLGFSFNLLNLENQINYQVLYVPTEFKNDVINKLPNTLKISDNRYFNILEDGILKDGVETREAVDIYYTTINPFSLNLYPTNIQVVEGTPKFMKFKEVFYMAIDKAQFQYSIAPSKWSMSSGEQLHFFDSTLNQWVKIKDTNGLKSGYYAVVDKVEEGHFVELEWQDDYNLENLHINCIVDNQYAIIGRTSNLGKALFFLPKDADIQLDIMNRETIIHSESFVSKNKAYSFEVDVPNMKNVYVEVLDCSFNRISEAILIHTTDKNERAYFMGDRDYLPIYLEGNTSHTFSLLLDGKVTKVLTNSSNDNIYIGKQFYCDGELQEYFIAESDRGKKIFMDVKMKVEGNEIIINAKDSDEEFRMKFTNNGVGSYENKQVNYAFSLANSMDYTLDCFETQSGCGTTSFKLFQFGEEEGSMIKGSFEGEFWISSVTQSNVGYRKLKGAFQFFVK